MTPTATAVTYPARSDVDVAALRETLTRRLEDPTGWSTTEWVEVGDLVADLAAVDQGRETLRIAFTWARRRPSMDVVASPSACEVLWALLNTPGASLPLTISQASLAS